MVVRSSTPRKRDPNGSVFKRRVTRTTNGRARQVDVWYARVRMVDSTGKLRELKRRADSRAGAQQLCRELRVELSEALAEVQRPALDKTFNEIADWFEAGYLQPAEYQGEVKVHGFSSLATPTAHLRTLRRHFGPLQLRAISYDHLVAFKRARLATPTPAGKPRSIASVNRELSFFRAILNRSIQQGWLAVNPFSRGPSLINISAETERMRVLTRAEESALLAHCSPYLRAAVICAIDTGLRRNEQFTLTWANVDLARRSIELKAHNAKTKRKRVVPITSRLRDELATMQSEPDELLFPVSYRKAFETATRRAGLDDLRWHDLRHTAITWMLDAGIPAPAVMRISGHSQLKTFLRYVNMTDELTREAAEKMDARRAAPILPLSEVTETED